MSERVKVYARREWRGWLGTLLWVAALELYPGDPLWASVAFWLKLFGAFLLLNLGSTFVADQRLIDKAHRDERELARVTQ